MSSRVLLRVFSSALILFFIAPALGLPNIRIQVNNENLSNPPYLLEAIKKAELEDPIFNEGSKQATASLAETRQPMKAQSNNMTGNGIDSMNFNQNINADKNSAERSDLMASNTSTRAILPSNQVLDQETLHRLKSLIVPVSTIEYSNFVAALAESELGIQDKKRQSLRGNFSQPSTEISEDDELDMKRRHENQEQSEPQIAKQNVQNRKKQTLPVTSSHLKRPANLAASSVSSIEEASNNELSPDRFQATKHGSLSENKSNHSLNSVVISPTTVVDGPSDRELTKGSRRPVPISNRERHEWQPMKPHPLNLTSSGSPAILMRDYGPNQARTRITTGGGYVREKEPVSEPTACNGNVSIDQSQAATNKLEPLEDDVDTGAINDIRVIEIPNSIVLRPKPIGGISTFDTIENNNHNIEQTQQQEVKLVTIKKPDPRCLGARDNNPEVAYEHPRACDKYFKCQGGQLVEHTCPNGLMYGTSDIVLDFCVHRWQASCLDKTVPNPISSPGCRWQYGIFNVQGSPRCSPDFYECRAGKFEVHRCTIDGQVYDDRTKSCQFAEKVGCSKEALADFKCPTKDHSNIYWPFPRYLLNERAVIHCVHDKPLIVRCEEDERVDPESLNCVPRNKQMDVIN